MKEIDVLSQQGYLTMHSTQYSIQKSLLVPLQKDLLAINTGSKTVHALKAKYVPIFLDILIALAIFRCIFGQIPTQNNTTNTTYAR